MSVKQIEKVMDVAKTAAAVLLSFAATILLICVVSSTPLATVKDFFLGPFASVRRIGNIVEMAIPILFTSCAICIMYSTGHINMGTSGCFYMGGLAASAVAFGVRLIPGLHPAACMLFGGLVGALIAAMTLAAFLYLPVSQLLASGAPVTTVTGALGA